MRVPLGENGLGLDSLALVEFVLSVEKTYGTQVPDTIWANAGALDLQYFADLVAVAASRKGPAPLTAAPASIPGRGAGSGARARSRPAPPLGAGPTPVLPRSRMIASLEGATPPAPQGNRDADARPIRLLHVVDALALAGMEYGVIKLVNRLPRGEFVPMICCLRFQVETTRSVLLPDVNVVELHKRPGRNWRLIFRLARILRREKVDIVHSHNWQTLFYTALAARVAGIRVHIHGEHGREEREISPRQRTLRRLLLRRASQVVAVSAHLYQELLDQRTVRPGVAVHIPNGVDTGRFGAEYDLEPLRRELGLEPHHRVILNVGGLRRVKDHPTLLRALRHLLEERSDVRVVLVGGEYHEGSRIELDRLAESLGVCHALVHAGVREDIPRFLSLCDIYVNTSTFEGMSNTILEAMASRKPVVATTVGGNSELLQDGVTGILFPPGDHAGLAARLGELLRDPLRCRAIGAEARAWVESTHPMERMVEANCALYRETWAAALRRR